MEYTSVGELLRNVYGTEAKIVDVVVMNFTETIKYTFDGDIDYYTTIEKLQDRYHKMIEYSSGRITSEEYGNGYPELVP